MQEIFLILKEWQTLFGALLGASAPFTLWWFVDWRSRIKERKTRLYYIYRLVIDQMRGMLEARSTIKSFADEKLVEILKGTDNPEKNIIVQCYLPSFSFRTLPSEILNVRSVGNLYLDNKLSKIYSHSHDLPHIFGDLRYQLQHTLEINREIIFAFKGEKESFSESFHNNLKDYKKYLEEGFIYDTFPYYFKELIEVKVLLELELHRENILKRIICPNYYEIVRSVEKKTDFEKLTRYIQPLIEKEKEKYDIDLS